MYLHTPPHSVPVPSGVLDAIKLNLLNNVQQFATAAVNDPGVVSFLTSFSARSAEVRDQLTKLDSFADAHFDEASFYLSGIVFRGWISTAGRWPVQVKFDKVDDDTISALQTWIPGGRIDHFLWTWSWTFGQHDPGAAQYDDRFEQLVDNWFSFEGGREPSPLELPPSRRRSGAFARSRRGAFGASDGRGEDQRRETA